MAEKLRIAFIGAGSMGQCAHLRSYATLPDCQVVALAELRGDVRKKVAVRYGVPRTYSDHEELLAEEKLDGIVASQPFSRHGVLVPELLKAVVPVFIEKPLAGSVEVGERIVEAVKESGTWLMVGYNKRSDPAVMYAKEEIERLKESNELGKLRYVRLTMPPGDWIQGGFDELIKGKDRAPALDADPPASEMDEETFHFYRSFVNYYIHQVNLLRHLLGEPYEPTHADPSGVLLVARAESGVAGLIEMNPYRTTADWQESALTAFERGYVRVELPAPLASNRAGRVEILRDPGDGLTPELVVPHLPSVDSMKQQAVNFLGAIRGEAEPPCEAEEALEDLKVAREYVRAFKGR